MLTQVSADESRKQRVAGALADISGLHLLHLQRE
jgi:hypothetical protein